MPRLVPIVSIEPGSAAARAGLRAGDQLRSMNGADVRDIIDVRFEGAEETVLTEIIDQAGLPRTVVIERQPGESLGIETAEMRARTCANKCVFCFIDQMPKGGRRGLYVRDEDYRFSFLHGNYVTLTNTGERDLQRIITQRLSPLYVSVHATDPLVRARLLDIAADRGADVMPVLRRLADGGIDIHAQVVLCPGWNDGTVLDDTLGALASLYPRVQSVAVVPLGLTRHRQGLPALGAVTEAIARQVLAQGRQHQQRFEAQLGCPFVYLADEWYFLTGEPIPAVEHYQDFPQLEDGVGMTRRFIQHLEEAGDDMPVIPVVRDRHVVVVTGVMAAPMIEEMLVRRFLSRHAARVDLVVVENAFLGPGITVSGLLAGEDIARAVEARGPGEVVLLPPNCVNGPSLFLDDVSLAELTARLRARVELGLGDESFATNPVWEKT